MNKQKIFRNVIINECHQSFFSLFIDGIKLCVINIVYMIIPMLAFIATVGYAIIGIISSGEDISLASILPIVGGVITGLVITIILAIIFGLLGIIGSVRFARTGEMGQAFAIGEIMATIGRIGWVHYIASIIALMVVVFFLIIIITIIELVLAIVPIAGWIIGWILSDRHGPAQADRHDVAVKYCHGANPPEITIPVILALLCFYFDLARQPDRHFERSR